MPKQPKIQGNAHYTIHIPTHDPHGYPLQDLASMAGGSIQSKLPRHIHSIHVEGPHPSHPFRHLKILAVDSPEVDGHIKSVATEVGQMSGHPQIFAYKDSQQGYQPWTLNNRTYDGAPSQYPEQPSAAPTSYQNYP